MRLVTYNIHKGIGGRDRRYDLERIIDVLDTLEADFVCLQEVTIELPRTSSHDQANILAERFQPMFSTFQQNVHWKVGGYGNQVLSRWPFREHHRISLQFQQKKQRGAQLVVVETPTGLLRLTNWHLGLSERERHWQTHHLLTHPIFHSTAEHPTLMCGDFNDWRNTLAAIQLFSQGFVQATTPPSKFRSFPATLPVMSLDKIFHCDGIVIESIHAVNTRQTRQASDHLPLLVNFSARCAPAS
ncbi:MAG: endonuclease/exonuclease/phosphatase family protein [Planctomycetaceae bacterium]|nr:endonuclease/exonuclease/phosphatase family protein [Planctomycetaceae bacterium]